MWSWQCKICLKSPNRHAAWSVHIRRQVHMHVTFCKWARGMLRIVIDMCVHRKVFERESSLWFVKLDFFFLTHLSNFLISFPQLFTMPRYAFLANSSLGITLLLIKQFYSCQTVSWLLFFCRLIYKKGTN